MPVLTISGNPVLLVSSDDESPMPVLRGVPQEMGDRWVRITNEFLGMQEEIMQIAKREGIHRRIERIGLAAWVKTLSANLEEWADKIEE